MTQGSISLPPDLEALLRAALGGQPISALAATSGGFSNLTLSARVGEQRCVIKAASAPLKRADLRREARVLGWLHASELPVPRLLALAEDQHWTAVVTRFVDGAHGLAVLEQGPAALTPIYGALGALLAAIHHTPAPEEPGLWLAARAAETQAGIPSLKLHAALRDALLASLEQPLWHTRAASLVHGDAGLHNLLWDGRVSALLDWEWAGVGTPLLDLAWLYWTMRWRNLPADLWQSFLAGYGAGPAMMLGGTPAQLRALALGQIAGILLRVQDRPDAYAEWLRRLRWSLELVFPNLASSARDMLY